MLGVLKLITPHGKGWLRDETGRVILFDVETDVTGSFSTFRDIVRDTFVGIDHDANQLICMDQGATTRTMLQIKGTWHNFSILGSAECGAQLPYSFQLARVIPRDSSYE